MKQLTFVATILIFFTLFITPASAQVLPPQALAHIPVCPPGKNDSARCHAHVISDGKGKPHATTSPTGLSPAQFLAAYGVSGVASTIRTIAIVDAYDHPSIYSDLTLYSNTFGIPVLGSCAVSTGTVASPCFQKVDQRGGTTFPAVNSGWALEIALDVQAAHALCQNCNILLVEADSNSYSNLMAAVDRAISMGAQVISNSYGSKEFSGETFYDSHFNVPGKAITFSSGDSGYGAEYPASSRYVTAVGGTTLSMAGTSYLGEKAWSGSGSGCSLYETKPVWQHDTGCKKRTVADVAADADPNTGASVYNSVPYSGQSGWFQVGGTSLASPLIAAIYALAGDVGNFDSANSLPYTRVNYSTNMHDIVSGANGRCRRTSYLCTSGFGYDGPTGLGTPIGLSAF